MGRSRTPGHQRCPLGDPDIGLPERHLVLPGLAAEQDDRLVHQPRVGRERDCLGLHRGVHRDALQVLPRQRPGLVRHREALLQQGCQLLFAQALAPAGQRGALERQHVLEALFAAEVLVVGVLQPARAQDLVGKVVHVLQDEEPSHQPCRQGRLTRTRAAHRAEPAVEKLPVDLPRQPRQWMTQIDDLLQRRSQEILLPSVPRLAHRSFPMPETELQRITTRPDSGIPNRKKTGLCTPLSC